MQYKPWHRLISVLLVAALLFTILPAQRVSATGDALGGVSAPTAEDYDYIRLDSLMQNERTITVAYATGEEMVRFSSYVAGGSRITGFVNPTIITVETRQEIPTETGLLH